MLMLIASLLSLGVLIQAVPIVAVVAIIVVCGAVSFANRPVLAVRVSVFNTVFTATMFAFKLNAFSCHFFFWECFLCPGPGMLSTKTEGDSSKLVLDFEAGSVVLVLCDL